MKTFSFASSCMALIEVLESKIHLAAGTVA